MPQLPEAFVARMREQLGAEAEAFFACYDRPRMYGLRLNPLKLDGHHPVRQELVRLFDLRPVPWCPDGYYYEEDIRPGKHPYHTAGLYYIQEPSAMLPAELLEVQPGDLVLDLAAAPGGKTVQIAGRLGGRGVLVSNDPHPDRAKVLSQNVERLGVGNAIVTSASPEELRRRFPETFDRILVDAPCSGEGMFRKDPDIIQAWSPEMVRAFAARQRRILREAAAMLKPGGRLVYSTCTFNREENEETVAAFLAEHPEFRLVKEERLWPHLGQGEGHYAAVLTKGEETVGPAREAPEASGRGPDGMDPLVAGRHTAKPSDRRRDRPRARKREGPGRSATEALEAFLHFAAEALPGYRLPEAGVPLLFGESLYWLPLAEGDGPDAADLSGLRVLRPGLHLGQWRKGRFEPAHALAMACRGDMAAWTLDAAPGDPEIDRYLRGESFLAPDGRKGWGLVTVNGWPLGWLKAANGQLKNHLPKGLRQ